MVSVSYDSSVESVYYNYVTIIAALVIKVSCPLL